MLGWDPLSPSYVGWLVPPIAFNIRGLSVPELEPFHNNHLQSFHLRLKTNLTIRQFDVIRGERQQKQYQDVHCSSNLVEKENL